MYNKKYIGYIELKTNILLTSVDSSVNLINETWKFQPSEILNKLGSEKHQNKVMFLNNL